MIENLVHIVASFDKFREIIAGEIDNDIWLEWFLLIGYDKIINPSWVKLKGIIIHWDVGEFYINKKIRLQKGYFRDREGLIRLSKYRLFDATGRIYYDPKSQEIIITYDHTGMTKFAKIKIKRRKRKSLVRILRS